MGWWKTRTSSPAWAAPQHCLRSARERCWSVAWLSLSFSLRGRHARSRIGGCWGVVVARTFLSRRPYPAARWGAVGRGLRAAHRGSTLLLLDSCSFMIGSISKRPESHEIVILVIVLGSEMPRGRRGQAATSNFIPYYHSRLAHANFDLRRSPGAKGGEMALLI